MKKSFTILLVLASMIVGCESKPSTTSDKVNVSDTKQETLKPDLNNTAKKDSTVSALETNAIKVEDTDRKSVV